jgi:hypothetical protein
LVNLNVGGLREKHAMAYWGSCEQSRRLLEDESPAKKTVTDWEQHDLSTQIQLAPRSEHFFQYSFVISRLVSSVRSTNL